MHSSGEMAASKADVSASTDLPSETLRSGPVPSRPPRPKLSRSDTDVLARELGVSKDTVRKMKQLLLTPSTTAKELIASTGSTGVRSAGVSRSAATGLDNLYKTSFVDNSVKSEWTQLSMFLDTLRTKDGHLQNYLVSAARRENKNLT